MFFRRSRVSEDMRAWIDDCFEWFDGRFAPPKAPILPTKAFFSAGRGDDLTTAKAVLADVQRLLDYDLPIALEPLPKLAPEYRHSYQQMADIAGTYQESDGTRLIQYNPEEMQRPRVFINTMAHEVMHARLSGLTDLVPGGHEAHELATDLGCIIAGFGVFQMQAADDSGWSGYMTQDSRAHALAVFLQRRNLDPGSVAPHLSGRCLRLLRRAYRDI